MWLNVPCLSASRARSAHPKPSQICQPLLGQSWLTFGEPLPEHSRVSRHSAATGPIALATGWWPLLGGVFKRMNAFCVNSPLQNISIYLEKLYSINIELCVKTWKKCVEKQGKLLIIQWGNVIVDVLKFVHLKKEQRFWNAFKMIYFFISQYKV